MKTIFTIDGNYFGQRTLGALNMGDRVNNLETPTEKTEFTAALNSSLMNLYSSVEKYVDNIIFVVDRNTWRKKIPPHIPYYLKEEKHVVFGYKEQRVKTKEDSPIDYNAFHEIYYEFVESLKSRIMIYDIDGLEGDDVLMLLANKFQESKEHKGIVFCTDGDLVQTVNEYNILMRNIKSSTCPDGEFVITQNLYEKIFEGDTATQLIANSLETNYYRQLFGLSLRSGANVKRTINEGISIATPFKTALIKSICGDKKDNIFSIFSWPATTGTKMFKLTENHLEKAFKTSGLYLTENNCKLILTNKDALLNLVLTLRQIVKQEKNTDMEDIGNHLRHNFKMIILSKNNIPAICLEQFNQTWDGYKKQLDMKIDSSVFKGLNINRKDNAVNILENSIPDII